MTRLPITLCLVGLTVAGCAKPPTPEPIVRTVEVRVPVAVACDPRVGPDPLYADNDQALAAATDVFEAMRLRIAGRLQRIARVDIMNAALAGCARQPVPEPTQ